MAAEPELAMSPDRLLLVGEIEITSVAGMKIGEEGVIPQLHIGFTGRINNSKELATYWVALSPEDAHRHLVGMILDSIEKMMGI